MFESNLNLAVYLYRDHIDFRKNINGLAALVEHDLARRVPWAAPRLATDGVIA